jgi:hypothetical protein
MGLTRTQVDLLQRLRSAVASEASRYVVYCTEYLGYLPFGLYLWVEVNGKDIGPSALPPGFSGADLDALEAVGLLHRACRWTNADDNSESKTTYEVVPA